MALSIFDTVDMWEEKLKNGYDINREINSAKTSNVTVLVRMILEYDKDDKMEKIEWLIAHGADVNHINKPGRSTISYALMYPEIVKLLIMHGATIFDDFEDYMALSIYNYGSLFGRTKLVDYVEFIAQLDIFSTSGNPLMHLKDNFSKSPILSMILDQFMTGYVDIELMKKIITNGYLFILNHVPEKKYIRMIDSDGNTMLHYAINGNPEKNYIGNPIIISNLIYRGISLDTPNIDDITPYDLLARKPKLFDQYNSSLLNKNIILLTKIERIELLEEMYKSKTSMFSTIPHDIINLLYNYI